MVQDGVVVLDGLLLGVEAVLPAEDLVVPQRELVAGHEAPLAGGAAEAVRVEDLVLGPHHVVRLAEGAQALVTLVAEQPVSE